MLIDRFGRRVDGFRISVTNRCNHECFFCHIEVVLGDYGELKPSDWGFLAEIGVELGIIEYKLTGGEPLVRRDIVDIVREIWNAGGSVSITTNGSLLSIYAKELVDYVDHVNVSLHSLDPVLFNKLTNGKLEDVLYGLEIARENGLRVKLNYVVNVYNMNEFRSMIRFAETYGFDLNIIELIPLGIDKTSWSALHVDLGIVEKHLEESSIETYKRGLHNRVVFKLSSGINVSLIKGFRNPIHCMNCSRLRVTPDGAIKTCLYSDAAIDSRRSILERDRAGLIENIHKAVLIREPFFK